MSYTCAMLHATTVILGTATRAEALLEPICQLYDEVFSAPPFLWTDEESKHHRKMLASLITEPSFGIATAETDTLVGDALTIWHQGENRTFGLTAKLYPDLDMSIERGKAAGDLIREYFDRYGPASLRDAMWWSGLSRSAITTAMNGSPRHFVALQTPWCQSPLYMYNDRHDQFRDTWPQPQGPALNFLAHEDVALKAYSESRGRYLGNLSPRCAFNQIGEALPTILYDGQIVGLWAWDASRMAVWILDYLRL
jgi:winged helix DNA-binding protein